MAFDAFCYFPNDTKVKGETQDDIMASNGAFEILSFEIGAENNINIGSISSGGGAGKATFKELTITKKTDTSSAAIFSKLCEGAHFDKMNIELRRSGVAAKSGDGFLLWEFELCMIQDISWSGSDGDDVCEETLVLQYGAMKVSYTPQGKDGKPKTSEKNTAEWSRVLNKAVLGV